MSTRKIVAGAFAGVLCFFLFPVGRAQLLTVQKMGSDLYVQVRMETTGEATLSAWSQNGGGELAQLLPQVLHCQEGVKADATGRNTIRCSRALRRDGLALEAVLDLAPIVRGLKDPAGLNSM